MLDNGAESLVDLNQSFIQLNLTLKKYTYLFMQLKFAKEFGQFSSQQFYLFTFSAFGTLFPTDFGD